MKEIYIIPMVCPNNLNLKEIKRKKHMIVKDKSKNLITPPLPSLSSHIYMNYIYIYNI